MAINVNTSSSIRMSGSEAPGHCHDLVLSVKNDGTANPSILVSWKDSYEGVWGGTKAVLRKGNPPRNELDGTMICNSMVKHQYMTEPFEYPLPSGSTSGTYHVTLFPYSTSSITNTMRAVTKGISVTVA